MKTNYAIIGLSVLSTIFFFGWVLPKIPYTRRLPEKKAEDLYVEYIEIISRDRMTLDDSIRINEIASRLTDAGYTIVEEGNSRPLLYPRYAGSIARIL